MKKLLLILFIMLQSLNTGIAGDNQFLLSLSGSDVARVGYIHDTKENINLQLINDKGSVLFEEEIEPGKHYFKFLNIADLDDGNYFFKLENQEGYLKKALVIRNADANVVELGTPEPRFTLDSNEALFSYHNKNEEVIKFMVIQNNDILFEKYFEEELIHHQFDLSQYPVEQCSVVIQSDVEKFEYPLASY